MKWGKRGGTKAQVTVFIIVGVLILFIFLGILFISSQAQKEKLERQLELTLGKAFTREALRIYVQDCLEDDLVDGVKLLGRQGAIWAEQGGRREFTSLAGVDYGEDKVAYAITYQPDIPKNRYPCSGQYYIPDFCRYKFPNTTISFGKKKLTLRTLEEDLEGYLLQKTVECMEEVSRRDLAAELDSEGVEFEVEIDDNGITVNVHYPLQFQIGEDEYFHLSEFDFFFPTKLKQVLDVAVLQPLNWDRLYLDFDYTEETLTSEYFGEKKLFKEKYEQLGISLNPIKLPDSGDSILEFSPTWGEDRFRDYVFRVARQNRPPALDYISRCPQEDFDYLVVPGTDLDTVEFTPFALDPDEDEVIIKVKEDTVEHGVEREWVLDDLFDTFEDNKIKEFEVSAKEEDGPLKDWQSVRVIKRPMFTPTIDFYNPLEDEDRLSVEDPICVNITVPEVPEAVTTTYSFQLGSVQVDNLEEGKYILSTIGTSKKSCAVREFDIDTIRGEQELFSQYIDLYRQKIHVSTEGRVTYDENNPDCNYEATFPQQGIEIKQCLPNSEENNVLPYFSGFASFPSNINEFEANHACCSEDGTVLGSEKICYEDPNPGCYGGMTEGKPGYILEKRKKYCSGQRGNICDRAFSYEYYYKDEFPYRILCGDSDCNSDIPIVCREKPAWSIQGSTWCYGGDESVKLGCEEGCRSEIVDRSEMGIINPENLDERFGYACGCNDEDVDEDRMCLILSEDENKNLKEGVCTVDGCRRIM